MDIGAISIGINLASVNSAVGIAFMKLSMNCESQVATQMTDMMSNAAIDTTKGMNIDAMA